MNYERRRVIAKKYFYGETYYCPHCNKDLGNNGDDLKDFNYCPKCGQMLDWNVVEDTKAFVEI